MSNKWWMVVLGMATFQGINVFASEHKSTHSPRNPLSCSTEVKQEVELVAAFKHSVSRASSGDLQKKEVNTYCNGGTSAYYHYGLNATDMRPYYSDFPGQHFSGY